MIPLLLDVAPEALSGPLSQFQSRRVDEKGMQDIIQVINQRLDSPENEGLIRTRVRVLFPELLRKLEPKILWGRLGVMAEYIRIGDQPTLASL